MGKQDQWKVDGSKTCILKFDMHCQCNGCIKKINDGVKEISLSEGVKSASLLIETGEVKVTGRMDPEKLCSLLHAMTKKCVEIVAQSTLSEGRSAPSQEKNQHGEVPCAERWVAPELSSGLLSSGLLNGAGTFAVTPSAPPLPLPEAEAWSELTVPSERCWYRWPAPLACGLLRRTSPGRWPCTSSEVIFWLQNL